MNSVAREEATTEVVTSSPPPVETAPMYHIRLHPRPHVNFDDSVVDNEHLGRRRSKKCCIFHKKRDFNESSSESDEEEADESGSDAKHHHHEDCKTRTRSKKRVPSPSFADEEKTPAPPQ